MASKNFRGNFQVPAKNDRGRILAYATPCVYNFYMSSKTIGYLFPVLFQDLVDTGFTGEEEEEKEETGDNEDLDGFVWDPATMEKYTWNKTSKTKSSGI